MNWDINLWIRMITPGGDMYKNHMEFLEWAREYDTGGTEMRSRAKHDEWQKLLLCKQIILDGAADLEENFQAVQAELNSAVRKNVSNR